MPSQSGSAGTSPNKFFFAVFLLEKDIGRFSRDNNSVDQNSSGILSQGQNMDEEMLSIQFIFVPGLSFQADVFGLG